MEFPMCHLHPFTFVHSACTEKNLAPSLLPQITQPLFLLLSFTFQTQEMTLLCIVYMLCWYQQCNNIRCVTHLGFKINSYKYLWSDPAYITCKGNLRMLWVPSLKTFNTYVRCTAISIKCKCYKIKQDLKPEKYIDKYNLARLKSCFFNRLSVYNPGIQSWSISLLIAPKLTRFLMQDQSVSAERVKRFAICNFKCINQTDRSLKVKTGAV